ncbi:MAG: ATP diphosphatase [Methylophagaceae bacterium]|jgi:ATP diphosphatase
MSDQTNHASLLNAADKTLATLNYAVNLQYLAAQVGFDWPDITGVVDKIKEELNEVIVETSIPDNQHRLHDEMGDLLFACTNLARHLNIDPEQALIAGNRKFYRRFSKIERLLAQQNKTLSDVSLSQLDQLWEQVKKHD